MLEDICEGLAKHSPQEVLEGIPLNTPYKDYLPE